MIPPPAPFPSAHDRAKGGFKAEDISRVEIERIAEGKKLVFERDPGKDRWRLVEGGPSGTAIDRAAVDRLVRSVLEAKHDDQAGLSKNLADYDLAPPRSVVTLSGKDRTFVLNVGKTSPGT